MTYSNVARNEQNCINFRTGQMEYAFERFAPIGKNKRPGTASSVSHIQRIVGLKTPYPSNWILVIPV